MDTGEQRIDHPSVMGRDDGTPKSSNQERRVSRVKSAGDVISRPVEDRNGTALEQEAGMTA
jgi:hypothetical protein